MAAQSPPNATMLALTPAQIMSLPPQQQQQYVAGLSPQMQAIYQQEVMNIANADFMRNSLERTAQCFVTGGSGQNATFTPGSTLSFDLPTTQGFAKGLLIEYNLVLTASAATVQLTQSAPWSLFSRLELDYNGPQIVSHPFVLKQLDRLKGFCRGDQNRVLAGNNDTVQAANIVGLPAINNGANTWKGYMYLPLNAISDESPYGLLPINGVGNRPQLKLTCATLFGTDPLLNPTCANGSSGQTVTVTGNVNVDCVFIDGTNMESIAPKTLQGWQGMPTLQYYWEQSLTPFNAALLNRFTISTKLEHWYALAIVIDGQQSNTFMAAPIAGVSNLTQFGLSPDPTGQQFFVNYNIANNQATTNFFDREIRRPFGQDLDQGVIAWVAAPGRGVVDSDNKNGTQFLNMYSSGYPATSHMYQVTTIGTVCTARVELFLVSKNNAGLKIS